MFATDAVEAFISAVLLIPIEGLWLAQLIVLS